MVSQSQWNICTKYLVWAKYLDSVMYLYRTKYLCWATSKLKTPVYFGSLRRGTGATSPDAIYPDAQHIHHQVHLQPPGVLGQAKVGHTTPGGGAIRIDILLQISYFFVLFLLTIIMSCSSSWEPKLRVDECQLDFNSAQTPPQASKPQLWPHPPPPAGSQSVTRRRSSGSGFVRPLLPRRRHWRLWSKVVAHDGRCARWRRPHRAYM